MLSFLQLWFCFHQCVTWTKCYSSQMIQIPNYDFWRYATTGTAAAATTIEYQRKISCIKTDTSGNKMKQYYKWWNITFSNKIEKVLQFIFSIGLYVYYSIYTFVHIQHLQRCTEEKKAPKIGMRNFESIAIQAVFSLFLSHTQTYINIHINKIGFVRMNEWLLAKNNRA